MSIGLLSSLTDLSDDELLARVRRLVDRSNEVTAHLVAHLAELDSRRLYLGEGCSSLFTYCTEVLGLSESAAYRRIEAARAARKFPVLLEMLAQGAVHLTAVVMLAPHLTLENHEELLAQATHKTKRELEVLVARLRPQSPVPSSIRKLPSPREASDTAQPKLQLSSAIPEGSGAPAASAQVTPARPAVVAPLAPELYRVQFTTSAELHAKLCRARELLHPQIPAGDVAALVDRALTVLLADLEKRKMGATERPRKSRGTAPGSRHIPAEVRRKVWERDGGQCTFLGRDGRRCSERAGLEIDHIVPHALGGEATVENTRLRCGRHNVYEAERVFGPWVSRERRRNDERGRRPEPDDTAARAGARPGAPPRHGGDVS